MQPSQSRKKVALAVSGGGRSTPSLGENVAVQRMLLSQQIGRSARSGVKNQPAQKRWDSHRDVIVRKTHLH